MWDQERPAGDIAAHFDVSWPAISQQLRILKDAGLVRERREGTSRLYRADHARMGGLRRVLEEMWRTELLRLKDLAEAEERTRR